MDVKGLGLKLLIFQLATWIDSYQLDLCRISSCFNDSHQPNRLCHLFSLASDLIIDICIAAIDSLDYPPSAIAAAVVLWITNLSVDEQNLGHLHNGVNQGMVKKIYKVIEGKRSSLKLMPQSPTCVLEAALLCKEIAKYC
ncbi:hypothetical protein GOBAR_AA29994 [Gossypium barbadense]|uniref:Uncharacterized protein n=1 Tax=Gossypium barbadense TaxID=3634 RepID=A0A2P5WHX3_GOSBA|nr:hypothetical protein GOBAR_AA29994 [Gossypium barbadense]